MELLRVVQAQVGQWSPLSENVVLKLGEQAHGQSHSIAEVGIDVELVKDAY